jgi:hypothetical protein
MLSAFPDGMKVSPLDLGGYNLLLFINSRIKIYIHQFHSYLTTTIEGDYILFLHELN